MEKIISANKKGSMAKWLTTNKSSTLFPPNGEYRHTPSSLHIPYWIPSIVNESDDTTSTVFKIPHQTNTALVDARLKVVVGIHTMASGGGGTYQRPVDYFMCRYIDKVELRQGGSVKLSMTGEEMLIMLQLDTKDEFYESRIEQLGGNLTPTERNAKATAEQTYYIGIPFFWTHTEVNAFPLFINKDNPLYLHIYWKTPTECIETNYSSGTQTFTRSSAPTLRLECLSLTDEETAKYISDASSSMGILYNSVEFQSYNNVLVANGNVASTDYNVTVKNINKEVYDLSVWHRPRTAVSGGTAAQLGPFTNFVALKQFELKANGSEFVRRETYSDFVKHVDQVYYYGTRFDTLTYPFTSRPTDRIRTGGYAHFGNIGDILFYYQLTTTLTADNRLDFYARTHRIIKATYNNLELQ